MSDIAFKKDKIVGVIGGMGPEATTDLMLRVIRSTLTQDYQDHIRMVVDNNPKVPSRIRAIVDGTGESPAPCLVDMARKLAKWGVDFLAIPCNTAHYYYDAVCSAVNIPVLNMIDLTTEKIVKENPGIKIVGLLASDAVHKTALYFNRFKEKGVDLIYPSLYYQQQVMAAIRLIKAGKYGSEVRDILRSAATELIIRKAESLIVACTELSIIADAIDAHMKLYDSAQVLAENIVRMAKGQSALKKND